MKEIANLNAENPSAKLLLALRRLFGEIDSQANIDLVAIANEVKQLIFEQLIARGNIDPDTSYEVWLQEAFPGPVTMDNSRLLELAKENDLIKASEESDFLKANLQQIYRFYMSSARMFGSQQTISEMRTLLQQDTISREQYHDIVSGIIRRTYG